VDFIKNFVLVLEITMTNLSPSQAAERITAILSAKENHSLDFKRISSKHKSIVETICAFANSDGGLLVIGVGDAKDLKPGAKPESRLFGIEENPEAFDDGVCQAKWRLIWRCFGVIVAAILC
jgi:Putative DNA-binding domain